ncbi:MAG: 2,3-bisphosphoglycerate-independent phosphoglycerate mutase [Chitinophagales bacterium]|nr:2,3-bisphosphoglycerate-independent phosphoglycerate mutase [Chitinophagales bacterium]
MGKKIMLMIMDGWGHGAHPASDAIYQANVPFVKSLYSKYPHCELITCGEAVGLPEGQMGNSEVGHMNIGAGRIVYQELLRINKSIEKKELHNNASLLNAFKYAKENNKPLHLIGLVSNGGVHSHINHLKAICDAANENGLTKVFIHAFTDGRDTDPKSGLGFLTELQNHLQNSIGEIASVIGRYYAMDRDNRWQRVKLAYDLFVLGEGKKTKNILESINESYSENVTDEFIKPIVKVDEKGNAVAVIEEGDAVICFNFRTDRCREITKALTQQDIPEFGMKKLSLNYTTMTVYDHSFQNVQSIFSNTDLNKTLGEVLADHHLTQIRIAETEKYPHVTFFFNGGREKPFEGENRFMIPSPKVATYDLQPEMSAIEVKNTLINKMKELQPNFICINFANPDMVGHTGVMSAVKKAVETIDACVSEVATEALKLDYVILLTADHGNADYMINPDGSPNTAHSLNPVPLFMIGNNIPTKIKDGKLADIAPTILTLMGVEIPKEMDGIVLVSRN